MFRFLISVNITYYEKYWDISLDKNHIVVLHRCYFEIRFSLFPLEILYST